MSLAYFLQQRVLQLAQLAQQAGYTFAIKIDNCPCSTTYWAMYSLSAFTINQNTGQITLTLGYTSSNPCGLSSNVGIEVGTTSSGTLYLPIGTLCGLSRPSSITITITPGSVYST